MPKTIDNDVGDSEFQLIDHTPGYGSVARYWMHMVQNANEENAGSCPADPVLVLQAMGRKIGFIPAAARLADPASRDAAADLPGRTARARWSRLADQVNDQLRRAGRCDGRGQRRLATWATWAKCKDSFGHTQFGSSQLTVAQAVVNYLNAGRAGRPKGPPGRTCRAPISGTRWPTPRRSIWTRPIALGQKAARTGRQRDQAATWPRSSASPGRIYNVRYDKVPLAEVANSERTFPADWITPDGYRRDRRFRPLRHAAWSATTGRACRSSTAERLARFKPIYAEQKLPKYVLQADRK